MREHESNSQAVRKDDFWCILARAMDVRMAQVKLAFSCCSITVFLESYDQFPIS